MRQSDYTDKQFGCTLTSVNAVPEGDTDDAFISPQLLARPELAAHIAHPPTLAFLKELLGEDLGKMVYDAFSIYPLRLFANGDSVFIGHRPRPNGHRPCNPRQQFQRYDGHWSTASMGPVAEAHVGI